MKKTLTAVFTLLAAVTLVSCGSNSSSGTDNGGKTTTSTKKAKVTKSSTSKSEEVTNGLMLKVGQWKNDDMQGKMVLYRIQPINRTLSTGKYSIVLKDYKMFEVTPKTNDQKQTANDAFSSSAGVTTPYYEIQIQYTIKNATSTEVQFNGIKSIVTGYGEQLDPDSGMSDQGTGATVAANASKSTAVQGLIKTGEQNKLKKITINFDSFCTTTDFTDLGTISPVTVQLK